jgi:hypothetical protein
MAALAETEIETFPIEKEEFAHSQTKWRAMGAVALQGEAEIEWLPEKAQAWNDFLSGISEMLATDEEFQEVLDIDPEQDFEIVDGQARDLDGKPLVEVFRDGASNSSARAFFDKEFKIQAERDQSDVYEQEINDQLQDGESHITVSMYPIEGLKNHPEVYKDYLGYREYLVYFRRYSRVGDSFISGASSILVKDIETFKKVLAANDIHVPDGETSSNWVRHGKKEQADPAYVKTMALDMRADYYKKVGMSRERHSVTEYIEANRQVVETLFNTYYPELGKAIVSHRNNETLKSLTQSMLKKDLTNMAVKSKKALIKVANSELFNDELGKDMDAIIRYAVVEVLRDGLAKVITKKAPVEQLTHWSAMDIYRSTTIPVASLQYSNNLLSNGLETGIKAERSYGGCAGQVKMNADTNDIGKPNLDPFNSNSTSDDKVEWSMSKGRTGKRRKGLCAIQSCPTRPRTVEVGGCSVCIERCQKLFDRGKDPTKMASTVTRKLTTVKSAESKPKAEKTNSKTSEKKVSYSYN